MANRVGRPKKVEIQYAVAPNRSWNGYTEDYELVHWNANDWFPIYKQMLNDETISAASMLFASVVYSTIARYSHSNAETEHFISSNLQKLFSSVLLEAIQDVNNFGFHVSEVVYEYDDKIKKMMVGRFVRLEPELTRFIVNDNGKITGVRYYGGDKNNQIVDLPIEKVFYLTNGIERGVYGKSLLDKAYRWWKFKKHLIENWAIAMEKYSIPPLVGKTIPENLGKLADALSTLYSNGVITINKDDEVTTVQSTKDFPSLFNETLKALNMLLFRTYFLPNTLGESNLVGSYALAKIQVDPFYTITRNKAEAICRQILEVFVANLLKMNGMDATDLGQFTVLNEPTGEEKWRIGQLIVQLSQAGFITPNDDNEWVRNLLRFPTSKKDLKIDIGGDEGGENDSDNENK